MNQVIQLTRSRVILCLLASALTLQSVYGQTDVQTIPSEPTTVSMVVPVVPEQVANVQPGHPAHIHSPAKVIQSLPEDDDLDEDELQIQSQEMIQAQQAQLELQSLAQIEKLRVKLLGLEIKDKAYNNLVQSLSLNVGSSCDAQCTSTCFESAKNSTLNQTLSQTYLQCVLPNCAGCQPHLNLKFLKNELEMGEDLLQGMYGSGINATQLSSVEIPSNNTGSVLACNTQCAERSCMKAFKKSVPFEVAWGCTHSYCGCSFKIRENVYGQYLQEKARQAIVEPSGQVSPAGVNVTQEVQPTSTEVAPQSTVQTTQENTVISQSQPVTVVTEETPLVDQPVLSDVTDEQTTIQSVQEIPIQENTELLEVEKMPEVEKSNQQIQKKSGSKFLVPVIILCHLIAIFGTFIALTQIEDYKQNQAKKARHSKIRFAGQNKVQNTEEPEFERIESESNGKNLLRSALTKIQNLFLHNLGDNVCAAVQKFEKEALVFGKKISVSNEKVKEYFKDSFQELIASIQRRKQAQIDAGNDMIDSDDEEIQAKPRTWQQRDREDEFQYVDTTPISCKSTFDDFTPLEKIQEQKYEEENLDGHNNQEAMKLAAEIINEMETKCDEDLPQKQN